MIGNFRRHHLVTILMLLAGLGSAAVIYLTAESPAPGSMVDEFEESKNHLKLG
jgi:hypothetical protein